MVRVGLTNAFDVVATNPEGLLVQAYISPETAVAPIVALAPIQIYDDDPALAAGIGFTVKVAALELLPVTTHRYSKPFIEAVTPVNASVALVAPE